MGHDKQDRKLLDAAIEMRLFPEEKREKVLVDQRGVLEVLVREHGFESTDVIRILSQTYRSSKAPPRRTLDRISTVNEVVEDPLEGRTVLGPYEIAGEIGRGGMGVVYRARQRVLDRIVALKVIRAGPDVKPSRVARFRREALAAARLSHPNILQVHDLGHTDGLFFLAMEFIEGYALDRYLADLEPAPRIVVPIVRQIADALAYAHKRGVIHRDVKPANILIDLRGIPYLSDFGVAKLVGETSPLIQTRLGSLVGTLQYMSPEQRLGQHPSVDLRTDIFSLGVTLYELLTRRLPYDAVREPNPARWKDASPPSSYNSEVSKDLDRIVSRAIHLQLEKRYSSARLFCEDLDQFMERKPLSLAFSSHRNGRLLSLGAQLLAWKRPALPLLIALAVGLGMGIFFSHRFASRPSSAPAVSDGPQDTFSLSGEDLALAIRTREITNHLHLFGLLRARRELEQLRDNSPTTPWPVLALALLHQREADPTRAHRVLDQLPTRGPLAHRSYLLAIGSLTTGRFPAARTAGKELAGSEQRHWKICGRAILHWTEAVASPSLQERDQKLDEAELVLAELMSEEPLFEPALLLKTELAVFRHDWPGAKLMLEQRLRLRPAAHDLLCRRGEILLQQEQLKEAHEAFDAALRQVSASIRARLGRVRVQIARHRWTDASREVGRILAMAPSSGSEGHVDAWILRAQIRAEVEDLESALVDLDRAESMKPWGASLHTIRGSLLARHGRLEEGLIDLQKAVQRAPAWGPAHRALGEALLLHGDFRAAREAFEKALLLQTPRTELARGGLGTCMALMGDFDRGLPLLDGALLRLGNHPAIHGWLGRVHHAQNNLSTAREHLNRALRLDGRRPDLYLERALVREALGDPTGARKDRIRAKNLLGTK